MPHRIERQRAGRVFEQRNRLIGDPRGDVVVLRRADHLQLLDRWHKIIGWSAMQPSFFQTKDPGERILEPLGADLPDSTAARTKPKSSS